MKKNSGIRSFLILCALTLIFWSCNYSNHTFAQTYSLAGITQHSTSTTISGNCVVNISTVTGGGSTQWQGSSISNDGLNGTSGEVAQNCSSQTGLRLEMSGASSAWGNSITVSITFTTPVNGPVTFNIYDLTEPLYSGDNSAYYQDKVSISATNEVGAAVIPSATVSGGIDNAVVGNNRVLTANVLGGQCLNQAISIGAACTKVKTITIFYNNQNPPTHAPGGKYGITQYQYIFLSNINYQNPPAVALSASPTTVCPPAGSTLTATAGFTSYDWGSGNVPSNTTTVYPTATTTYTVVATNSSGCTASNTVTVNINSDVIPTFTALGPYCAGDTPGSLLTTSTNGINGTWSPATVSSASSGTTSYTFTPNAGQCATTTTMNIVVNPGTNPNFAQLGPYCSGDTPGTLPATSTNGITGTWSPATISTAASGTTTYTFTPTAGQCANNTSMNITVTPGNNPTFAQLGPYCTGDTPGTLPATSTNSINGTWSPATISTAASGTTTFTFTPTAGQCANNATMNITVTPGTNPTFAQLGPYCAGATPGSLPAISTNGINGTWSPATVNTASSGTTTYTFTPTAGQCATTTTMSITVSANVSPTFTALGPYCAGATPGSLAGTSNNGIAGTWSPATISTISAGTTNHTFTPNGGQCATNASMSIVVNANVTPLFTALGPYCAGATPGALAGTSTNGIAGTWSPATISTISAGTTNYTFTPNGGQCATTTAMPVTVNANVTPAFSALGPYCVGATPGTLSGTSTNGINGTWSPSTISTVGVGTTTYTFTPSGSQCATTASMPVTVNAPVTPSFSALGPYCEGATPGTLQSTSANGITGTWSPATISTASVGTTTYSFTANGGQCASNTSMNIIVSNGVTPLFNQLGPYCAGQTPASLSNTSMNSINGNWSPASISTSAAGTTVYTFTPTVGQCAINTTMSIVTNSAISASISGGISPLCYNSGPGTFTATASGGVLPYTYQWYSTTGIISGATNSTYDPGNLTASQGFYCTISGGSCAPANTPTTNIVVYPELEVTISGGNSPICDKTSPGTFTVTATGGTGSYTYQWYNAQGAISGATNNSYTQGIMIHSNGFYCRVTSSPCGWLYSDTTIIIVVPQVGNPTPITVSAGTEPICQLTNGITTTTYSTTATNNYGFTWSLSNSLAGTIVPSTGVMTWADGFYGSVNIQVVASGCGVPSSMVIRPVTVSQSPTAEAGTHDTYTGTPIQIGNLSNGPGTFNWSPSAGLNDPAISQPLAFPGVTTTYTLTISNNGCIATDTVTIYSAGGFGHTISGKVFYAGKANTGNPVPNQPTYNPIIYAMNNVIVVLKSYPANNELARDTSDVLGHYQFTNIMDGNYVLAYDQYAADTMMWANDVNAIDVALMKYFIGSDTVQDPTRCFKAKYKKAANVDNNAFINAVDVARIKAKIGAPYDPVCNFPRGNWVAMAEPVSLAGSDIILNLETISYGDYNASSSKYRDSLTTWSGAKSIPSGIIVTSEEYMTINDPSYFEIPLRISSKMNEFSALGLELNYPNAEYKLVAAYMPGTKAQSAQKINPTLEEIIANDNDLLVTDIHGTIRVVYATTNHFDVAPNDAMIILGFRALKGLQPGEVDFTLTGTGVIGNQFGEENDEAYLLMPKVLLLDNNGDQGLEFSGYPNPFNGEATIAFNLPETGVVKLSVYNSIGELVSVIVDEVLESGNHSVVFAHKNLPSGLYTFKLEVTANGNSKSMIMKLIH